MLSDEEKISLNRMKLFARSSDLSVVTAKDMDIVVTLVEKESKEIEELKDKLEKTEISLLRVIDTKNIKAEKLENSISKDKIKAKIEEVEQWELYNMKIPRLSTLDERLGAKIGIKYVLQSLIEKE